jgi:hypothetical protein
MRGSSALLIVPKVGEPQIVTASELRHLPRLPRREDRPWRPLAPDAGYKRSERASMLVLSDPRAATVRERSG